MMKIDTSKLQKQCDATVYTKGFALYQSNSVRNLQIKQDNASAVVEGTFSYHVHLAMIGDKFSCHCTCPAAEYQVICKHCIAVAFKVNDTIPESETDLDKISNYLHQKTHNELIELLLNFIERNETDWNNWLLKVQLKETNLTLSQLKSVVIKALPLKDIFIWNQVQNYFLNAEQQLNRIESAIDALSSNEQWLLINHLIKRLNKSLERIDDSGGYRLPIEQFINDKMPVIFNQLDWDDEKKALWLFENIDQTTFDVFPSINDSFIVSESVNQYFLALCLNKLKELCHHRDNNKGAAEDWERYRKLSAYAKPLIDTARTSGNWQEEVKIKAMIAESSRDYLELSKVCMNNQQNMTAESWLIKARKAAKNKREQLDCDYQKLDLLQTSGENQQAWELANQIFQNFPDYTEYQKLSLLYKRLAIDDSEFLTRVEKRFKTNCPPLKTTIFSTNNNDDLVKFYLEQNRLDDACLFAKGHQVGLSTLQKLANSLADNLPQECLEIYLIIIVEKIKQTNNSAYQQAINDLQSLEAILQNHPETLRNFYKKIKLLSSEFKNKRNMQSLFKQYYSEYI